MRILRNGGEYLAGRELRGWTSLAGLVLLAAVLFLVWSPLIGVLALVPLSLWAREILEPLRRVRTGRLGEEAVTELLRSLSDHYYLVNDVTLGRLGNVDHVLVGPCGVVVIETKRIAGGVRCNGDGWYVRGWPRKSFSRQVNANAVAVKDKLREWYPDQAALALRFVESVIVFTNPLCRLEINQPRAIVVRYSELLDVIRDLARRHQLSVDLAGRFARTLALDSVANGRVSAPR